MRRFMLPALAGLIIVGLLVWAFAPRPVAVETAAIMPRTIAVTIEEEGKARIREVFTVSAPIGGKLQRIALHAGDEVQAGKTVVAAIGPAAPALLDTRSRAVAEATLAAAEAAVALATAQLTQAKTARDFAVTDADRYRALFDRAAVSKRLLDTAVLAQQTAEAAVESATATLTVRQRELDSAQAMLATNDSATTDSCCITITAPVSGRILRVVTEDEQIVQPGTPILEIGDLGNLEIVVDLLSRDAIRVPPGAVATITGWGGPPLQARVNQIEPAAVTKVSALGIEEQRVEVILSLTGDPQTWRALGHGFRVLANIQVWLGKDVLSVPVGALFRDGSDWAVFSVSNNQAALRHVTLGERNEEFAQVLGGLNNGDTVILHPGDTIADGTKVTAVANTQP